MPVSRPSIEELSRIADSYGYDLSRSELEELRSIGDSTLESYTRIDQLDAPKLPVSYRRDAGQAPTKEQNPYGAWAWKCSIKGAAGGPLSGRKIALKDNICVAGIPMRNGSKVLEGYVPDEDATVVTRILDAGGEITGKAVCENFCFSGGSHTSEGGVVRNPIDPQRSTGGSSSGSGALVACGDVDMALGGDQGGSIRIPSSWCGTVGLKPTHGLVPYTGIFPIEASLDHTGPMTRSVADAALLLEVIAGEDGLDPRQVGVRTDRYTKGLDRSLDGLRVSVVKEGYGWPGLSEEEVDETVRSAARSMNEQGAKVKEISLPLHRDAVHLWNAIALEGATAQMVRGDAIGWNWRGHYPVGLANFYGKARREKANDFPATVKLVVLLGQYMSDRYHGHYYATAQNLGRKLRAEYDAALSEADVLVMPTTPMRAQPIPVNPDLRTSLSNTLTMIHNTCPFDITGHPAISIPCGQVDGLPVGLMLVGRHFEESLVLGAANAFEISSGLQTTPH
jgi:amidase